MRAVAGSNLSITLLDKFITDSGDRDKWIAVLILLLSDKSVLKIECWKILSRDFFRKYRKQIFTFCGYQEEKLLVVEKIEVEKMYCSIFLVCVGEMMREGVISHCSYMKMADLIDLLFRTGYTKSTILNKLKEQNPDFWKLEKVMKEERKRININLNKNND